MCSTGHQGAHGHEFLEFEYSYGEFSVGDSDRNMSAVPTILIRIHQDVFGMPTTPTTEMTALSEKRVCGILHLLGWKGGFEEKMEELCQGSWMEEKQDIAAW